MYTASEAFRLRFEKRFCWISNSMDRVSGVIGKLIYIKDILHACYEFRVFFCRDAPVVVFLRSKFVSFNAFRIASLLTGISRITLDSSSSRRIVHREWPSGTGPQASSISRASTRPSTLRLALSEFILLLNSVTASRPPFIYFVTVFVTVARQTPLDLALCSLVRTFPCNSSRSSIIWHLQRMVFEVDLLRIMDLSSLNSSSVTGSYRSLAQLALDEFILPQNLETIDKHVLSGTKVSLPVYISGIVECIYKDEFSVSDMTLYVDDEDSRAYYYALMYDISIVVIAEQVD